jgi:hypothetical protein
MFEIRDPGIGTAVYSPSGSTAGSGTMLLGASFVTVSNIEPIDVTGLANFRVVTPNAADALTLTSPAANTARLNGTSGGVSIGPVTFRNVGTFVVDAAVNDAGGGNDSLTVTPGAGSVIPNNVGFIEYRSGTGANTLNLVNGSIRLDSTVAAGGTLDTTIGDGAELITHRFRQNAVILGDNAKATILQAGTADAVSRLTFMDFGDNATLDLNDNSLVIDFAANASQGDIDAALAAIRSLIVEGRGGPGLGNGVWNGTGITSSVAKAVNATNPESRSIGYAHNGSLPLGPYASWRGQTVDTSSFLIGYTRTGDATLDSIVNDDDVTILGAFYKQAGADSWAEADFDYSGAVDDDDATLLGAFYDTKATPFPAPAPQAAGEVSDAVFADIGDTSSSADLPIDLVAAIADQIVVKRKK